MQVRPKKSEYLLHIFCHQANVCISISQFGEGGVSQLTKQLPKLHLQHTSCLTWVCCCWLLHRNSIQSLCHCCLLPYNTKFQKFIFCPKIYKSQALSNATFWQRNWAFEIVWTIWDFVDENPQLSLPYTYNCCLLLLNRKLRPM